MATSGISRLMQFLHPISPGKSFDQQQHQSRISDTATDLESRSLAKQNDAVLRQASPSGSTSPSLALDIPSPSRRHSHDNLSLALSSSLVSPIDGRTDGRPFPYSFVHHPSWGVQDETGHRNGSVGPTLDAALPQGLALSTEAAMLAVQAEALRRSGTGERTMAHLPSSSSAAVDSFAATLIREKQLEDAFYMLDIGALNRLFLLWQAALPRVKPFYAVKCNPSLDMLLMLSVLGAGFDCASEAELKAVLDLGVSPDRVIFANPCKMPSHIKFAAKSGVHTTTFDSEAELDKIRELHPQANLVLRIQTRDSGARCPLGCKYGALPEEVNGLLAAAAERNLNVTGVSFHVGSGASDPTAYYSAIAAAHDIFEAAASAGRPMSVLDIGGGFTAPRDVTSASATGESAAPMSFFQAAQAINAALDEFFPTDANVDVIAEPGRFFAETPSTLAARVFGKRVRGARREYWINDGLYGSMNCILYDHAVVSARPLQMVTATASEALVDGSTPPVEHSSTVFGPTCDGLDVIFQGADMPELQIGDWLIFPNMGAYTAAAGSSFNGFSTSELQTHLVYSHDVEVGRLAPLPSLGAWAAEEDLCVQVANVV